MASEPSNVQAQASVAEAPAELAVNLQIVSPSVGVNRPLLFPELPAVMTIKELKEKIRQSLPLRPADENQRLIHRGRALLKEADTLLDVFGAEALRLSERQTIHLVIRDLGDSHSSSPIPTARGPSPASSGPTPAPTAQHAAQMHFAPNTQSNFGRRTHSQPPAAAGSHARMPSPSPAVAQHQHDPAFHQQHHNMSQWLSQVQRDAMARAIVQQNQRGRAQMGMRGISDNTADPNSRRASPAPTHTIYRETVGPNGRSYHVETIMRGGAPGHQGGLSPAEVQNILHGADASQATTAMTAAMQRSASGASIHGRPLNQPGVTTPISATALPFTGSDRATPDQASRAQQGVEVYVLSSPEGPRALLFNNTTSETYYSPRLRMQNSMPHLRNAASFPGLALAAAQHIQAPHSLQQQQPQQHYEHLAPQQLHHREPQPQNIAQPNGPVPEQQPGLHPANPPAAGIPPLLMQAWPHIWLIFRLAVFVWLFTSPNSSWSRWFTVICLAIVVFLLSTGLLNGIAENAWRPIGRHLENLLPDFEGRPGGGQRRQQPVAQPGDPDPAQMAARLVAERNGPQGWLATQVRRLERAGLLFLASIAPGVAERHIANLEAEVRAEEARQREAEAAAAAAAAEAEAATAAEASNEQGEESTNTEKPSSSPQPANDETGVDEGVRTAPSHGNEEAQQEAPANVQEDAARENLINL